jgi:hypothetical protein
MNKIEYLLTKVSEECAEVSQRASKAAVFGLDEKQKEQELNNAERLILEFNDLLGVMEMLVDEGFLENIYNKDLITNKKIKLLKYMQYSRQLGKLDYE